MLRWLTCAVACAAVQFATPAAADEQIRYGPPPPWVQVLAMEQPTPAPSDAGLARIVHYDAQARYGPDGDEQYFDRAVQVLSRQGLEAVGSIGQTWNPATQTLTIHRVEIIRNGQVIDALAQGDKFVVLRRETNLSLAILDGQLTASKQVEGLVVGDIVRMTATVTANDPILAGHSQYAAGIVGGLTVDRLRQRHIWPATKKMRWRATEGFPKAVQTRTANGYELLAEARNVKAPVPPEGAPDRYKRLGTLMLSDFESWREVSALFAPHYKAAATIKADSPLRAEVAKIRQAHAGKLEQASAALVLVEQQVRYLALAMGEGGFRPADADSTWSRRFGDCKAKSALLIALLSELGIEAEAALVNTRGDGLDELLPSVVFDHVIVRTEIDGKTYWLDGTRSGDRSVAAAPVPPFRWALPLRAGGSDLERLKQIPATTALRETLVEIDSTGGLDLDAPLHIRLTFRGDEAREMLDQLAAATRADMERYLREMWTNDTWVIDKAKFTEDAEKGEVFVDLTGVRKRLWPRVAGRRELSVAYSSYEMDFEERSKEALLPDAPYARSFPAFERYVTRVRLPQGGAGFEVVGEDVDLNAGGMWVTRKSRIVDGVFISEEDDRAVAAEVSASAAKTAQARFKASPISTEVIIRAPRNFRMTTKEAATVAENRPGDPAAISVRADAFLRAGDAERARADFTRSLELQPDNRSARVGRARASLTLGDHAEAIKDLTDILAANPADARTLSTRGGLHAYMKNYALALADFDAAVAAAPREWSHLAARAGARFMVDDVAGAKADIEAALKIAPDELGLLERQIDFKHPRGAPRREKAADLEALYAQRIAANEDDAESYSRRARLRQEMGDLPAARQDYDKAIALKPSSQLYSGRAGVRSRLGDRAGASADMDEAVKIDPLPAALVARARSRMFARDNAGWLADARAALAKRPDDPWLKDAVVRAALAAGDLDHALTVAEDLVSFKPKDSEALRLRAAVRVRRKEFDAAVSDMKLAIAAPRASRTQVHEARARLASILDLKGDYAAAVETLEAMHADAPEDAMVADRLCRLKATRNTGADSAVASCEAALKIAPDNALFSESLGLAHLRLKQHDRAIAAFTKALNLRPGEAIALYGRAAAREATGDIEGSRADAAAAARFSTPVVKWFASHGLAPSTELAAVADTPTPAPKGTVTRPDWAEKPKMPENFYPERALNADAEGLASISCTVTATGNLSNCTVVSEAPEDYGFGEAILSVSGRLRMRPGRVDGEPVDGPTINIPFPFRLD